MSLKNRLRLLVMILTVVIVVALSLVNVSGVVRMHFADVQGRAELLSQQVQGFVQQRLHEDSARAQPIAVSSEELLRQDPAILGYLAHTCANSQILQEISIENTSHRVLASSDPRHTGWLSPPRTEFSSWEKLGLWHRLQALAKEDQQYAVTSTFSPAVGTTPLVVRALVSPALLWQSIKPDLEDVTLISGVSLLVALILALLVSNLALQPLAMISYRIDQISHEQTAPSTNPADPLDGDEIATVQSKLSQLGQQYRGARQDAAQLRSNIDQMLMRLEEAVLLFDAKGVLVMAGRPAERLLGGAQQDLIGRTVEQLFPSWTNQGTAVLRAIHSQTPLHDQPITLERSGLPTLRLIVNMEQLGQYPGSESGGTLMTLRDADMRREIESQLNVSSRLTAINRLTSGVAHEIRNPLNAIMLHLELLRDKLSRLPNVETPELDVIAREMKRLDRVVKTFLEFTRPVTFQPCELDLNAVVKETMRLVKPQAQQRQIQCHCAYTERPATIQGDLNALKQALLNIVVNSVEAINDPGHIQVQVQQVFDDYLISITDNGAGIAPEVQDKIFNLFFTTKENASGIGLAVTFQFVQLHNGVIDFTSEPGRGTTFRLRFPGARPSGPPAAEPAYSQNQPAA